jgi:sortase (surface protein transpeptidase)
VTAPTTVLAPQSGRTAAPGLTGRTATDVAPSPPLELEIPAIGLRAQVSTYTDAQVAAAGGVVHPATLWEVAWWSGGGMPGSHADNTVYLYGHTWKEPAVFNRIIQLARGDAVFVTTSSGRLEYVVDSRTILPKTALASDPGVRAAVPGRLLLIGCYRRTGREQATTQNVVVRAHLASGQRATPDPGLLE